MFAQVSNPTGFKGIARGALGDPKHTRAVAKNEWLLCLRLAIKSPVSISRNIK